MRDSNRVIAGPIRFLPDAELFRVRTNFAESSFFEADPIYGDPASAETQATLTYQVDGRNRQIIRYGEVRSTWIGIEVQETRIGLVIRQVYSDSPAAQAGLQPGDWIRTVAATQLRNRFELDTALSQLRPGEKVILGVERDRENLDLEITVQEFPLQAAEQLAYNVMGIAVRPIPEAWRGQVPFKAEVGVLIDKVRPRSRAAQRGFRRGDVVIQMNGLPLRDVDAFRRAVARSLGRHSVLLLIQRGHFRHYVTMELS